MRRSSDGAALVAVVLITLALFAIVHGLLALSLGELAASRAAARHLEARVAADAAMGRVLTDSSRAWMDSVPVGGSRSFGPWAVGRGDARASLSRLSAEAWWLEGIGRIGVPEARTANLTWALDPFRTVTQLPAALIIGDSSPVVLDGVVDTASPISMDPPHTAADCEPWVAQLQAHYALRPLTAVRVVAADSLPRLGILDLATILEEVDIMVGGFGIAAPADNLGACATREAWNWGDPDRPWGPCGSFMPLRGSLGGIAMSGAGQGLLVVDGDLVLTSGARFYGLVLVAGSLRVEDRASLTGMAVARGGASVVATGRIQGSACWAARALAAQRATLGRLRPVPGVGAVGPI